MGLVIEIRYMEDGKRWTGEWEIWANGEIAPSEDYIEQIDLDLAEAEFTGEHVDRLKFYLKYKELGIEALETQSEWLEAFAEALDDQGIDAFDEDWDFDNEDVEIETVYDDEILDTEQYEDVRESKFCLLLKGQRLACWLRKLEARVQDPVALNVEVSDYGEDDGWDQFAVPDSVRSILDYFEIDEPEPEEPKIIKPEPVKEEDAKFGVLYKINVEHREDEVVAPYGSEFDALEAKELSDAVIERDGDESYIQTWHVRRLESGEEELGKERRADIRYPWGKDDPPEWMEKWIIMTDEERNYG